MGYRKTKKGVEYITLKDLQKERASNSALRAAYDSLEPRYMLIRAMIDARLKQGMTQAQIAKRAGTTQSAIARFEAGRTNPTLEFAERLARAIGAKLEIRLS